MNISTSGFGAAGINTQTSKLIGASDRTAKKSQDNKKGTQNSPAAVLTISNTAVKDRSAEITKRFQAMKESTQKQIDSLNEHLEKATKLGNTKLVEQLEDSIKQLQSDFSALDEQLNSALFEERKRLADEARAREEKAAKQREKEQDKHKPDEEKIEKAERRTFEFFAKADIAKENIQDSRIQKAKLEQTKSRLEGEMAMDAAAKAGSEQRHKAKMSEIANSVYKDGKLVKKGHSDVPSVSDKTILTEKKRISNGSFTADESSKIDKLNKLTKGITNFENSIAGVISDLNGAVLERTEEAKDGEKPKKEHRAEVEETGPEDSDKEVNS